MYLNNLWDRSVPRTELGAATWQGKPRRCGRTANMTLSDKNLSNMTLSAVILSEAKEP